MDNNDNNNENDYLTMANDFKDRFKEKNEKISQLTKMIFVLYGLIRRGLETEDSALFEEARGFISEFFQEEYEL
tara:strand:- start:525 stop:746 length:222 start_codon:yes stop_codon:yes gene_type:complete